MQFHAAFDDRQSQTRTGNMTDVASSMERVKQPLLVLRRNADTLIADGADGVNSLSGQAKLDGAPRRGIFHRIAEEVAENMAQQSLVRPRFFGNARRGKGDHTFAVRCGKQLIGQVAAKCRDIGWFW